MAVQLGQERKRTHLFASRPFAEGMSVRRDAPLIRICVLSHVQLRSSLVVGVLEVGGEIQLLLHHLRSEGGGQPVNGLILIA